MPENSKVSAFVLGIFIFFGLGSLGYLLGSSAIKFKGFERTVTVKGLAEKEHKANIVIWPIQFTTVGNNLEEIYSAIDGNAAEIKRFLVGKGINEKEISFGTPSLTDKLAQQYGSQERPEFRYLATQTVTVYSQNINTARVAMNSLSELGKKGIVLSGGDYQTQTEYLFTKLNEIKPAMIEEATRNAREVAEKFASDSNSTLGKIKRASQGQFSIEDRDKNNPHIKKIRVVSTVEYYLSD
ncbi:MAG: SIMPL domain-containing protein [Campylobacterales bacterium]|nr:SIMPL domain-containing protein [Campylobacterales bacterium]